MKKDFMQLYEQILFKMKQQYWSSAKMAYNFQIIRENIKEIKAWKGM